MDAIDELTIREAGPLADEVGSHVFLFLSFGHDLLAFLNKPIMPLQGFARVVLPSSSNHSLMRSTCFQTRCCSNSSRR